MNRKDPKNIDKICFVSGISDAGRRTYIVKPKIDSIEPDNIDLNLVRKMGEEKALVGVSSFSNILDREKKYIPKDIKSFLALPLFVEKDLTGVIAIEDLPGDDFGSFLILSNQFALQIRKVRLYETVQELSITDGLTGAYVRRHFSERLEEELKRSKRHRFKSSFLMLDIDHFKACNDTYGHLVGDAVLTKIVNILKMNIRQIDLLARYGGEEFSILLPETDKDQALIVAERIRKAVAGDKFKVYDEFTNITISIGVATFPDDAQDKDELIERADKALYRAKEAGRNRVFSL